MIYAMKQKEAKILEFTVKRDNQAVDLTDCTLFLGVKQNEDDAEYAFSKEDADFDKAQESAGIVKVFVDSDDLDLEEGSYIGELRITFSGSPVVTEKSVNIPLIVEKAITT